MSRRQHYHQSHDTGGIMLDLESLIQGINEDDIQIVPLEQGLRELDEKMYGKRRRIRHDPELNTRELRTLEDYT
jgi:hypothetical protein